jgi:Peptidase family M28
MAALKPRTRAGTRRWARRGSIERPVNGRIYRLTWALVAVPLIVAAFTVARPAPLSAPALPPSFDQDTAGRLALELAEAFPDRSPGSEGAAKATRWVKERLADYSLTVREAPFVVDIPGRGRVRLVNLVASPLQIGRERSPDAIVVMAHRDNSGISPGLDDNASGTAALIELARNLSTISNDHTIIFVSTDGGAFGGLGAAELASDPTFRRNIVAVVDLDALAGSGRPRLQFAGDDPRSPSGELLTTADTAILGQSGVRPSHPNAFDQLLDLAFPFSLYEQGPFVARGVSAVTVTSAGDRPPSPDEDTPTAFDPGRLGTLGRSAQALIGSLDAAAEVAQGTDSYVYLGGRYVRGFAIELFLLVAVLPALVATIDLAARFRRRGLPLGPALRSFRTRILVWAWVGLVAVVFSLTGVFPRGAPRPLSPDTAAAQDWPFLALLGLVALSAAGWLLARPRLVPGPETAREDELAGHLVVMLALCGTSVAIAIVNPFTLVFVLPSLHAWLWIPHVRQRGSVIRVAVYAVGLTVPLLLFVSFATRFELGFDAPWYVATLFSVGYAPVYLFLLFVGWCATAGQAGAILFGRYAPYPESAELGDGGPAGRALQALRSRGGSLEREEPHLSSSRDAPVPARNVDERVGLGSRDDHV